MADLNKLINIFVVVCTLSITINCTTDRPDKYEIKEVGIDVYDYDSQTNDYLTYDNTKMNEFCLVVLYFNLEYVETDEELYCPIEGCRGRNDSIVELKWRKSEIVFNKINIDSIFNENFKSFNYSRVSDKYGICRSDDSMLSFGLDSIIKFYHLNTYESINFFKGACPNQVIFTAFIVKKIYLIILKKMECLRWFLKRFLLKVLQ